MGQSLTTLSGGEGQRLKLSTSLMKKTKQKTLFLLDEPSTGLHPYDIQYLIELFNRLIEKGNSIIMVEHNIRMIHASGRVYVMNVTELLRIKLLDEIEVGIRSMEGLLKMTRA